MLESHSTYYDDDTYEDEEDGVPDGERWFPEGEAEVFDHFLDEHHKVEVVTPPEVTPSQFTEFAFRMPRSDGLGYEPFSFDGRRHIKTVYNSSAKRILLVAARQVEKSTYLGNIAITFSCMVTGHRTLYVSPSATQTKTFSVDRLKDPMETSEVLRTFTTSALSQNVFEKQFINRSKITLRYAFLNADRTRGIPAYRLLLDEIQDILPDNIPVIEQCTSHAPEQWKRFVYSGTPKSLDNVIEYYRSQHSTQGEWMVPCDAHGGETGRYWNVLGEKNIGKKGLICEKCGKLIEPMHEDAQWAHHIEDAPFLSFRIPQLMVPWKAWSEILLDYQRYPRAQFYNEVLGISFDSGIRPLTKTQVRACCDPTVRMSPQELAKYKAHAAGSPVFAGIDWGSAENTYTVLVLATYVNSRFRVFYVHRFEGEEAEPPRQLELIIQLLTYFNVTVAGTDYGGGFDRNDALIRKFGAARIQKYQYLGRVRKKVEFDAKLRRWKVFRTEVMSDIFNAIKRGTVFTFPRWEEFNVPFAQDMVNIYSEYNESQRMIQYTHGPGNPDDTFHALLYCFLASMLIYPRPDVIAPNRESKNQGPLQSSYTGPTDQG